MSGGYRRTNSSGGTNFNAGTARWRIIEQPLNKWQKRGRLRQQLDPYEASGKGVWLNEQAKKTAGQLRNDIQRGIKMQTRGGKMVSRGFKQRTRIKSGLMKTKQRQQINSRRAYGG